MGSRCHQVPGDPAGDRSELVEPAAERGQSPWGRDTRREAPEGNTPEDQEVEQNSLLCTRGRKKRYLVEPPPPRSPGKFPAKRSVRCVRVLLAGSPEGLTHSWGQPSLRALTSFRSGESGKFLPPAPALYKAPACILAVLSHEFRPVCAGDHHSVGWRGVYKADLGPATARIPGGPQFL